MFIPDAILLLCQGLTGFHVGNFLLSPAEEAESPPTTGESPQHPEGEQGQHTQDGADSAPSPPPAVLVSASESCGSNFSDSAPDTLVMAYPLSDMRNDPHTHALGSGTAPAAFTASGYTPYLAEDDVFMDGADPCNTSTPVRPEVHSPFSMMHSSAGLESDSDTSSSTVDLDSPRSDADTNITTPSTTNGSAFKTPNIHNAMKNKSRNQARKVYPKPTFCAFFSSPHVQNVERTRELWKHRLEIARRRAMANSLQREPATGLGLGLARARAAELQLKTGYIRRMEWIEGVTWDLPSEFEQYMFLLKLQAEEEDREARKEARERERAERGDSSDEEVGYLSESPGPDWGGEGYERGRVWERAQEEENEDEDAGIEHREVPLTRDIADFGRSGEFEEMKMRLDELNRNARAFSARPLFEEANLFDDDIEEVDDEGDPDGEHGVVGMPGYI